MFRIDLLGKALVRRTIAQRERGCLASMDHEIADRPQILAANLLRRPQRNQIWTCNRPQGTIVESAYPRHRASIVEAQPQLHPHLDLSAQPLNETHDVRVPGAYRHEINQRSSAFTSFETRLQH